MRLPIGEVGNLAYRGAKAVRKLHLPAPINPRYIPDESGQAGQAGTEQAGSKPRGESVYLFLEFSIVGST